MRLKKTRNLHLLALPLLFGAIGGISPARAQEGEGAVAGGLEAEPRPFVFGLSAGSIWSDNINLVPADENDGTIGHLGVELQFSRDSRRLQADLDLNAAYEHYFDDNFDNDVVGGFDGTAVLGIIPERFDWFFQDNFGQTRRDALAAGTPDNRENFNYFTTGPDFTLRLGSVTSVRLSGRYSSRDYEDAAFDGESYGAVAALIRHMSSSSTVSLNVESERFEYDDVTVNNEYDRNEAYLRYQLDNSRTNLSIDAGVTQLDDDGDKSDGELVRLSLRRQVSPATAVALGGGSEFSDAGNSFRASQDRRGVEQDPELTLATADAFRRRFGFAGWEFQRNRTGLGLDAEYNKEEYEVLEVLNRSVMRYTAYVQRQMAANLRMRLEARYYNEDYRELDAEIDELHGIVALDWAAGRKLSCRLQYDYRERDASGLGTSDYRENRVSVFVNWFPLGLL
jgi:hypothetical protein